MANTRAPSTIVTVNLTGQTDFNIPFEYLARKYVELTLLGTIRQPLILNVDYRFVSKTVVSLTVPPGSQFTKLEIRRVTSATERLVDFHDGSILRAYDLNLSQIQTLHVAEEARDLTADTIGVNDEGHLDARGRRIVNLADAVDGRDAITLGQVLVWNDSAYGAAVRAEAAAVSALTRAEYAELMANEAAGQNAAAALQASGASMSASGSATSMVNSQSAATRSEAAATRSETARDSIIQSEANAAASALKAKQEADRAEFEASKLGNMNEFAEALQDVDANAVYINRGLRGSYLTSSTLGGNSPWVSVYREGVAQAGMTIDAEGAACFILGNYTDAYTWKITRGGAEFVSNAPLNRDIGSRLVEGDLLSAGVVRAKYGSAHYAELTTSGDRARLSRKDANNSTDWEFDSSGNLWLPATGAHINPDGNIKSGSYHGGSLYDELNGNKQWKSFNPERVHGWTGMGTGYLIAVIDGAEWAFRFEASDARLKDNIVDTEVTATEVVEQMRFRDFAWGNEATFHEGDVKCGLIAQELLEIDPQFVTGCEDPEKGYYQLNVSNLLTLSLKAIQELSAKVEQLEAQLNK